MKIVGLDLETTGVDINNGSILEIGLVGYDTEEITELSELYEAPRITILVYHKVINNANIEALTLNKDLISEIGHYANEIGSNSIENRSFANLISDENNHQLWLVDNEKATFVMLAWLVENDFVELTNYGNKKYSDRNELINELYSNIINSKFINEEYVNSLKYIFKGITVAGKNVATFDIPYMRNNLPYFNNTVKVKHRMIDPSIVYTTAYDNEIPNLKECISRLGIDKETAHRAVDDVIDVLLLLFFHFKKSRYRTYLVFDKENNVISKLTTDDKKEIDSFKEKYKEYQIFTALSLHKYAVEGRLASLNKEMEDLQVENTNPLFNDREEDSIIIPLGEESEELKILRDMIISDDYKFNYYNTEMAKESMIQVVLNKDKSMSILFNLKIDKDKGFIDYLN